VEVCEEGREIYGINERRVSFCGECLENYGGSNRIKFDLLSLALKIKNSKDLL